MANTNPTPSTGPYLSRLETEENCSFHFVDGPIKTEPEASIAAFWDQPCYRFFHWPPSPVAFDMAQVRAAYDFVYGVIRDHGPFDGVLGFSQGSVLSVALMLHHAELHPEAAPNALFRFAILFSIPHLPDVDADGTPLSFGKIRVPSLHVCGEADEDWFEHSKETFEKNCEEGSARMIIHEGGHLIPKDRPTVDKILEAIGELLQEADA